MPIPPKNTRSDSDCPLYIGSLFVVGILVTIAETMMPVCDRLLRVASKGIPINTEPFTATTV